MSITTTMQARPGFTVPERFAALVTNLASFRELGETSFLVGPAMVDLWRPREGHWVLNLVEYTHAEGSDSDPYETHAVRTIAIVPGAERAFEVRRFENGEPVTMADCHSVEAALGIALDEVTKPVWQPPMVAAAMNTHDENGC
jgi:hypothetical protein